MLALLGPEIAFVKAMKDGMRHEEHEPQDQDRVRVVMIVMIGVPVSHYFIEPFVLDLPPVMANCAYRLLCC